MTYCDPFGAGQFGFRVSLWILSATDRSGFKLSLVAVRHGMRTPPAEIRFAGHSVYQWQPDAGKFRWTYLDGVRWCECPRFL